MKPLFDLASYFERIGYAGGCTVTLKTLEDLHLTCLDHFIRKSEPFHGDGQSA